MSLRFASQPRLTFVRFQSRHFESVDGSFLMTVCSYKAILALLLFDFLFRSHFPRPPRPVPRHNTRAVAWTPVDTPARVSVLPNTDGFRSRVRQETEQPALTALVSRVTMTMSSRRANTHTRRKGLRAVAAAALLLFASGVSCAEGDVVDAAANDRSIMDIASMNHVQGGLNTASQTLSGLHTAGPSRDARETARGSVRSNRETHPDFQEFLHKHKGLDHTYCPNQGPDVPCIEALRRYVTAPAGRGLCERRNTLPRSTQSVCRRFRSISKSNVFMPIKSNDAPLKLFLKMHR
jgi:hypothetical protein